MLKIRRFLQYRICSFCKQEFLSYSVERVNNKEYICNQCKRENNYSMRNTNSKGKQSTISFSFEFETSSSSRELYELLKYKFLGCHDASIEGLEWKSPIFYSRKSFHCVCKKIDKFARFVGDSCGTHLHVGTPYKSILEQYKYEIFSPILEEMKNNERKTKKFWGRYFNHYCNYEIENGRYNAFNTRSSVETLEFRLLKFKSAEQYIKASDFCIDITKLINIFIAREELNHEKALNLGKIIADKYKEVIHNV